MQYKRIVLNEPHASVEGLYNGYRCFVPKSYEMMLLYLRKSYQRKLTGNFENHCDKNRNIRDTICKLLEMVIAG